MDVSELREIVRGMSPEERAEVASLFTEDLIFARPPSGTPFVEQPTSEAYYDSMTIPPGSFSESGCARVVMFAGATPGVLWNTNLRVPGMLTGGLPYRVDHVRIWSSRLDEAARQYLGRATWSLQISDRCYQSYNLLEGCVTPLRLRGVTIEPRQAVAVILQFEERLQPRHAEVDLRLRDLGDQRDALMEILEGRKQKWRGRPPVNRALARFEDLRKFFQQIKADDALHLRITLDGEYVGNPT